MKLNLIQFNIVLIKLINFLNNIKVKQPRRLTLNNAENISDWEVTLLKRQKSYAAAAIGDLKGKVRYIS